MSFDALPNEIMACILNDPAIPLQERILLRALSTRSLTVIEDSFKKETRLTICEDPIDRKPNDLLVQDSKYFNGELAQQLVRLFPSVSELVVSIWTGRYYRQLPGLLSAFSTLEDFGLRSYHFFKNGQSPKVVAKMAGAINSITTLTGLHLFASDLAPLIISLKPTLGRLEDFTLCEVNAYHDGSLGSTVFDYLSTRCTHLRLNESKFDNMSSTKIDKTLTHLRLDDGTLLGINRLCKRLIALVYLSVNFSYLFWVDLSGALLDCLSRLDHLTELDLLQLRYSKSAFDPPANAAKRLNGVNQLTLGIKRFAENSFDGKYFCKTLAIWFPGLEKLTVKCDEEYHAAIMENLGELPSSTTVGFEI